MKHLEKRREQVQVYCSEITLYSTILLRTYAKLKTYAQILSLNIIKNPRIISNRTIDFKPRSYSIELCFLLV